MTDSESDKSTVAPITPAVSEITLVDVPILLDYIKHEFIGAGTVALQEAFSHSGNAECIQKFISDPQVPMLVVDRIVTRDLDTNPDDAVDDVTSIFRISNETAKRTERTTSLLLLKSGTCVEVDKPIEDQLYIVRIPEVDYGRGERDGDKLALSVEKHLSEVEVALLHMQQNIDIPEINLTIHPVIQSTIQQAVEKGHKARVTDLGNLVESSVFLNALQKGVNRWVKEIQKVTKLDRDAGSGTSLQEMTFWLNLERALQKIAQKRESDEVTLTLEALKCGKRFHATVSFDADTGLKQTLAMVNDYNVLMKDLPLNELMAATDMDGIRNALANIFTHMRKLRNTKYPIARALRFVEAISKDVSTQMLKALGTRRLMNIPLGDFDSLMAQCFAVFSTWNDEQHEQLRTVISRVLRPVGQKGEKRSDSDVEKPSTLNAPELSAIEQVNTAYENVKEVDCLDVSNDGTIAWEAAIRRYEDQIDRVETQITAKLRDQLGGAKNADEMFTIFQRFNALFVRPHIRGAIREYQTQLIQRVKEDIDKLQTRFKNFNEADNARILRAIDIPPVAASILWIRQIDNKLTQYMKRIEDVLGEDGKIMLKLKLEGDNFRQKLNTQHIFDDWVARVQAKNISLTGRIFVIEKRPEHETYGFSDSVENREYGPSSKSLYPFAISLLESIRTYDSINERIVNKPGVNILIVAYKKDIQGQLAEGNSLTWESYKMDPYVVKLSSSVNNFQEKVEELDILLDRIEVDLAALDTCHYTSITIGTLLDSIQKAVDQLSLGNFSNLHYWVNSIDAKTLICIQIAKKLASRVEEAIHLWTVVLANDEFEDESDEKATLPVLQPIVLEVRVTSQVMYVSPNIEQARAHLLDQLFAWQSVITNQPRISSTRFQLTLAKDSTEATYRDVLAHLPQGQKVIEQAYDTVEKVMKEVADYVGEWLRYQALWDLQPDVLYERLGNDVSKWMKTLVEIRKSRATFDTQETRKEIFPVVIDYAKVQSKVSLKYDYWHREILQKFGSSVGQEMQAFFSDISKWRNELEEQSIDGGTTTDAIQLITYVEQFRAAQRLLTQQRYQFPNSWLYSENVDGEWSALSDILERKDSAIQAQVANLQTKIKEEDEMVEKRTQDVLADWDKCKPVQGTQKPSEALVALATFEAKLSKVKEDRANMVKAKGALEMAEPVFTASHAAKLDIAVEELSDLKGVWQSLMPMYDAIDELKEKTWLSVQPRKLRQSLDELLAQLKQLPAKYRSYDSYDYTKRMLHNYSKMNVIVVELKSDALKERHWKQLMKELRVSWNLSELTLGQVWDADLLHYESAIRQVLLVAQGELALEEFLKQMREYWQSFEIDLVNYQNKTKLIRGWDDLFNKLKEHMNSLTAMKLSPYYKQFEEDALAWEEKLNKINALFDVWIDVQRRWVYLNGLFSVSTDINTLLPVESSRFSSISTEFLALMKKVTSMSRILDIINMQGAQRLLERLADMLGKIQKALGEYLERERNSFLDFILLVMKIYSKLWQGHYTRTEAFKKMFAGISSIDVEENNTLITAVSSREGERVQLLKPVNIKENPRINDWLRMVEDEMQNTLAHLLNQSLSIFSKFDINSIESQEYMAWLDQFPAQIIELTANIWWCANIEKHFAEEKTAEAVKDVVDKTLSLLADSVLSEQPAIRRKKIEALITEFVHKRDICRCLIQNKVVSVTSFYWSRCMRFYFDPRKLDPHSCCVMKMANACFPYGFEYLGLQEQLVQTPLTDRCYLTMTQALNARLGGSPFGPAGTGKTESVKALGHKIGRFVLVFNCDETFDFQAMGRILVGLCQVGAWGCFDEFNRLEERMLSAVSQQIQTIQEAVRTGGQTQIDLIGKTLSVNSNMAIFITMNPGYSGRSNLPDNLKQLFRSLAMTQPDRQLIAQVMLFSQGFRTAEKLAKKIVPLFILCKEQLSDQCHYDFGLRALKYVLVSAGNIKRDEIQRMIESRSNISETDISSEISEQQILIQSVCETLVPKLVSEDIALLFSLLSDVFPSIQYKPNQMARLRDEIAKVCDQLLLCQSSTPGELGSAWLEKVLQLYQITNLNHGLMLVGASGSGKTTAWKVLLKALERLEGVEGVSYVIDAKAMSKDALYGVLDPNTREWTDGLFTHIIRKIIDNVRGETSKRQWIIFDGDVDPEWVENLNSVLDDNKLLTLPNGERLGIPSNVRIIFEVADLKYATLATVSRCGMVWFSEEMITCEMLFDNFLKRLKNVRLDIEQSVDLLSLNVGSKEGVIAPEAERVISLQRKCAHCLAQHMSADALVPLTLKYALTELDHIMDDQIEAYMSRAMLVNIVWAFSGDSKWKSRQQLSDFMRQSSTLPLPPNAALPIIDYEAAFSGEWVQWISKVPQTEVETHRVAAADLVIPTVDTMRHEMLLNTWLSEHKPLVLCGPPGSGKTMTLLSALRSLQDMDVVNVNFSSSTAPELLMRTFDHYCEYRRTPNGVVLSPVQISRWLVIFCDEINLPSPDKYGTQRIISFLRQLVEMNGFYRASDQTWVFLERIQFVGACNPPTDSGRHPLSLRFLRHVPVVYVDYPGQTSLLQIYGTFNRAMLRMAPSVRNFADPLTSAMVDFYLQSQEHFTQDEQPHYIYSPRELTRWVRAISEAITPLDSVSAEALVRLWAHEALRLFQDRLVRDDEREWTDHLLNTIAEKYFGTSCDLKQALERPMLYSCWLTKHYLPVSKEQLKEYVRARLRSFYEEELDVQLVLFDQMLDHVLRIDRIYRQPQGHLLLIGTSGSGKTTLSRFVAWINGLSVFQLKVHSKYTAVDFDEDIRTVLRRTGCRNEKVCFIMDESNMLDTGFLERLNTLLANGEVPGLFEGDDYTTLMSQIKEDAHRQGLMLDSPDELYKWFTAQVMRNLHVVFTMNPSGEGLRERSSTSPALFNRCVLNWFGDWTDSALYQVGMELTNTLDMARPDYQAPLTLPIVCDLLPSPIQYRHAIINTFVHVHNSVRKSDGTNSKAFLDFIKHYINVFHEKRRDLEEEKLHLNIGLSKIRETEEQVLELQKSLTLKSNELETKKSAANAKLKEMLADQQRAEKEKLASEQLQKELAESLVEIEKSVLRYKKIWRR
ncbi:Dynein heavy chain, cytoplasmic [Dirofilaria immitis]|nr:Dynein heavy chain, cytoplasmic [Dirofilaria immitis]